MSSTKSQIQQKLNKITTKRHEIGDMSKNMQQYIQFMDYKIRKQLKSFTILSLCGAERNNFTIEESFEKAFNSLSLEQKVDYYSKFVENLYKCYQRAKKKQSETVAQTPQQEKVYNNIIIPLKVGKSLGSLEQTQIRLSADFKAKSTGKAQFDIDLRNYLLRRSKKKNYSYVLQAIKNSIPETVRFAFISAEDEQKFFPIIEQCINDARMESIKAQMDEFEKKKRLNPSLGTLRQLKLKKDNDNQTNFFNQVPKTDSQFQNLETNTMRQSRLSISIIQDIVKSREDQQLDDELTDLIQEQNEELQKLEFQKRKIKESTPYSELKLNRNIFKIILPNYSLRELPGLYHYGSVYQSKLSQLFIYQDMKSLEFFKMQFTVYLPLEIVCKALYNVQLYKHWHPVMDEGQIKLKISSQNSCIIYLKTKAFSEWYRNRDYLLLAHMFKLNNAYYIIEKSIQNNNYIPFQSITRGNVQQWVWKIQSEVDSQKSEPKCRVTMEIKVDHGGLLNKNHQKQLTLRFLKGFQNMQAYYRNQQNQKKLTQILGFDWTISDRQLTQNEAQTIPHRTASLKTCDFDDSSQISDDQIFYSIQDLSQQQKEAETQEKQKSLHQIQPGDDMMKNSQLVGQKVEEQVIQLDEEGLVILPKKYLKKKHIVQPFDTEKKLMKLSYESIVLKDHWLLEKGGGLKLVNQQKIDAQNNVFKFIMKTLKKNLFSGKGVTGISLPVEIFNVDSNLQRCCLSMSLGPQFLQPASKTNDQLERFKRVLAFGLSNSIIYFDVEKPFNPILGETYQGFIRGCPIYAQQTSHHPPISSIYFVGRGYKVTVSLQAKVAIHMNSGDGINEGLYHVIFDDGQQVLFQTPPAQLSGLAVGDRRFNFKSKGQYIDEKNNFFCEMKFESGGGGLWGKKKNQFIDQIQGQIVKVKPQFIRKFIDAPIDKKPSPSQNDIISKLSQLSGRWPLQFQIDGQTYYNILTDIPDRLVDDIYPLNSNSNYREDLLYRKKNDLSRSQIQKQRLQILQRGDRKFRQKFHGKAH